MNVTCTNCGWVHFAVTRKHAEQEVAKFNEYYDTLSKEKQDEYYGGKNAIIGNYTGCFACKKNDFRPSKDGDCPNGCTIQPVIYEESI